ncbi:MAG: hypothetical protein P8Y48_18805 [Novosphingobium sp.]
MTPPPDLLPREPVRGREKPPPEPPPGQGEHFPARIAGAVACDLLHGRHEFVVVDAAIVRKAGRHAWPNAG